MNEITIMSLVSKSVATGAWIAGPVLIGSLLVGLLISIFQAVTQIQEQTLTFVPKLLVVVLILVIGGPWMLNKLVVLTNELFSMIANITGLI